MKILEKQADQSARIIEKGTMLASMVQVDGAFTLAEMGDGNTLVKWSGPAKVGARLMSLLEGLLDRLVHDNVESFVNAVEAEMILERARLGQPQITVAPPLN